LNEPSNTIEVVTPSVQNVVGGHGFGRKLSTFNAIGDAAIIAATSIIARGSRVTVFSRQ
jgi:hypothetical protein